MWKSEDKETAYNEDMSLSIITKDRCQSETVLVSSLPFTLSFSFFLTARRVVLGISKLLLLFLLLFLLFLLGDFALISLEFFF